MSGREKFPMQTYKYNFLMKILVVLRHHSSARVCSRDGSCKMEKIFFGAFPLDGISRSELDLTAAR